MKNKPLMLWIDLTVAEAPRGLPERFYEHCSVQRIAKWHGVEGDIRQHEPDVLCFDFDYPDLGGLKMLRETKQLHPSIPILMLTNQHSEALAVWAFRSRVWDYLVKPVAADDVMRTMEALSELLSVRSMRRSRNISAPAMPIPSEVRVAGFGSREMALRPAIDYVHANHGDKIREQEAAARCGMSTYRFSRMFKSLHKTTFQAYVIGYRIRRARVLLRNPQATIADVACAVGFNDPSYFTRIFKRHIGLRPSEYREQQNVFAHPIPPSR